MRRGRASALAFGIALGLAPPHTPAAPSPGASAAADAPLLREVRLLMGTTVEVAVPEGTAPGAARAAFAALAEVDDAMSLWKETPLTRLNASGQAAVPPGLIEVLRHALDVARDSGGAFDVTVEPLVRAAGGLGGGRRRLAPPERARLLARVGASHVHLEDGGVVRLDAGTRLDLGGIAKGHAADRAAARLRATGVERGLVDLGQSSVCVLGGQRLAVRDPFDSRAPALGAFVLADACLATSGNDQKGAHVVDPRTGLPVSRQGSVTVVAASGAAAGGMEADALSTAAWVLGPAQGLALLARRGAHGLFVTRERGVVVLVTTPGFAERLSLATPRGVGVRESRAYFKAASAAS